MPRLRALIRWDDTMQCSACGGYGLVYGYMGEPTDCGYCGGGGVERARNSRGQFTPAKKVYDRSEYALRVMSEAALEDYREQKAAA